MPMCPGTFDQSSSSSTEFCDKNQIDIDQIIDLFLQCQYSICSFIFCFALRLQFPSLDLLFQSALHTRSTIINPRRQHGLQAALPGFQGLCSRPFNYCLLDSGQSLIRWRCTGFVQWAIGPLKKTSRVPVTEILKCCHIFSQVSPGSFTMYSPSCLLKPVSCV